jgi:hypothetical protein
MRMKLTFVLSLAIAATGCGDNAGWNEALKQTAPPNPYSATRDQQQVLERQNQREQDRRQRASATDRAPAAATATEEAASITGLLITLEGYPDCYSGSVRLYVDGRFRATFARQAQMELELPPGPHRITVWDSASKWNEEVRVIDGQTTRIVVPCRGREPLINEQGGEG